ncbi:oligosaccharide flippase family protein [Mucilaginibacter agri]|uniref:Oligosaccharide flippase family protein n=1 Tax=Mucilaginibacter agri TaxID=2695265 RepID=A0A965ZFH5_9SPHI|nr:oligosaccharide flippase family protein [Mucilaginibacter agri]NCD69044.1 oligosaccharide flippase family protein [Mucilaginibacter agri]
MKPRHIRNLSANIIQLIVNQVFGLAIFYVLSIWLDKTSFGQLNWVLAVLMTAFNILACGIDQLAIKKIAQGDDATQVMAIYIGHLLLSGLVFYGILALVCWVMPHQSTIFQMLLLIGAGKLMIYFSTPYKQLASGKEQFGLLAKMSVVSNIVRGVALMVFAILHLVSLTNVVLIFLAGDALEFAATLYLCRVNIHLPFRVNLNPKPYFKLLKEALPQIGVVLFTSALARFDWIFIGLYLPAAKLAEYSFAYKAFEISTLPLLAVAPLLLPRFVSVVKERGFFPSHIFQLLKLELVFSMLIAMVMYLCWTPLVDWFTGGKYGAVNSSVILVLSICMPLMYFNNFLWTVGFAQGRLRLIFKVFAVTFAVNVVSDLVLIPLIGNVGAALAYLFAMLTQAVLYALAIERQQAMRMVFNLLICCVCALVSGFIASMVFNAVVPIVLSAVVIYALLSLIFKQIAFKNLNALRLAVSE